MIERFGDREHGGFFTTAADVPHLVGRRKDLEDTPIPSGNSAAALGLLRLARLSGDRSYEQWAAGVLALHAPLALRHPLAFGHLLQALDLYLATPREVAIVGAGPLTGALRTRYRPHVALGGHRRGQHRGHGRRAAARPHHRRRPPGRLRVRALRLPAAGHRAGGTGGAALMAGGRGN